MAKEIKKTSGLSQAITPKTKGYIAKEKTNKTLTHEKRPRGFRITEKDRARLRDITDGVSELTNTKISDTHIIRALIAIGTELEPKLILDKIRQIIV